MIVLICKIIDIYYDFMLKIFATLAFFFFWLQLLSDFLNYKNKKRKNMVKIFSGVALGLVILGFTGCSEVVATKMDSNVAYTVQFSGSDFNVGRVVSSEMPYDSKNPNIKSLLLNKAITEHECDTILLPRYEIISKTFGKDIIKVTGRAATFKQK